MTMLLAEVVSPIGVGTVVGHIGYSYTLLVIVGSSAFNFIYVLLFLPPSDDIDDDLVDTDVNRSKSADNSDSQITEIQRVTAVIKLDITQ